MLPLLGDFESKGMFMDLIAESAGVKKEDVAGSDLFLYSRIPARSGARTTSSSPPDTWTIWNAATPTSGDFWTPRRTRTAFPCTPSSTTRKWAAAPSGARIPRSLPTRWAHWRLLRPDGGAEPHCGGLQLHDLRGQRPRRASQSHGCGGSREPSADEQGHCHQVQRQSEVHHRLRFRHRLQDGVRKNGRASAGVHQPLRHGRRLHAGQPLQHVSLNTVDVGLAQLAMHSPLMRRPARRTRLSGAGHAGVLLSRPEGRDREAILCGNFCNSSEEEISTGDFLFCAPQLFPNLSNCYRFEVVIRFAYCYDAFVAGKPAEFEPRRRGKSKEHEKKLRYIRYSAQYWRQDCCCPRPLRPWRRRQRRPLPRWLLPPLLRLRMSRRTAGARRRWIMSARRGLMKGTSKTDVFPQWDADPRHVRHGVCPAGGRADRKLF